jgi:chemotaxis signal transduction protein
LAPRSAADFIEGIAKVNGKFVILLNVNKVLSAEEIKWGRWGGGWRQL